MGGQYFLDVRMMDLTHPNDPNDGTAVTRPLLVMQSKWSNKPIRWLKKRNQDDNTSDSVSSPLYTCMRSLGLRFLSWGKNNNQCGLIQMIKKKKRGKKKKHK